MSRTARIAETPCGASLEDGLSNLMMAGQKGKIKMKKKVIVTVSPECISPNRELGYMEQTERAYRDGKLESNMIITEETEAEVHITFQR